MQKHLKICILHLSLLLTLKLGTCPHFAFRKLGRLTPGLEFQSVILAQNLDIPLKKIARMGNSHPEKFLVFRKFLLL